MQQGKNLFKYILHNDSKMKQVNVHCLYLVPTPCEHYEGGWSLDPSAVASHPGWVITAIITVSLRP